MIAGIADGSEPEGLIDELRIIARRARLDLLAGVHGHRLVVVLGGTDEPLQAAASHLAGRFGPGPVVVGPAVGDLQSAVVSAERGAGRPAGGCRRGRRRRGRSTRPTCCPSARWTATTRRAPS